MQASIMFARSFKEGGDFKHPRGARGPVIQLKQFRTPPVPDLSSTRRRPNAFQPLPLSTPSAQAQFHNQTRKQTCVEKRGALPIHLHMPCIKRIRTQRPEDQPDLHNFSTYFLFT